MPNPDASFSDLDRAADLARSLQADVEPAPDQCEYASLDRAPTSTAKPPAPAAAPLAQAPTSAPVAKATVPPPPVAPTQTAPPPESVSPPPAMPPPPVSPAYGSVAWDQFLDGCMRLGSATGGFILDHSGLAVALHGDLPGAIAESLGSRLVIAMGYLESETHLGTPDHPCIAVRVPGGWLSTATVAGGELAIGLFAPSSLGSDVWALIHDGASEMLALRRV